MLLSADASIIGASINGASETEQAVLVFAVSIATNIGLNSIDEIASSGMRRYNDIAGEVGSVPVVKKQKDVEIPLLPEGSQWERNVLNSFAIKQEFCNDASILYKMTIPEGSSLAGLEGTVGTQGMGVVRRSTSGLY